jgi:recombination protein RecT
MPAPTTAQNGQIQPRAKAPSQEQTLVTLVQRMGPELARAVPKHVTPDRMSRIVLTALRTTPKLALCTQASFLGCVMSCAQLGLEPNTPLGHAYLIPRENKRAGTVECTMIIGYQGMLDLSYRSGFLSSLDTDVVKKGDLFDYARGLRPRLEHVPSEDQHREKAAVTHAWVVFHLKGGAEASAVLSRAQIEMRKARSASANASFSPWKSDYDAMCAKTVIRAGWKWIPKSSEMSRALALDEAPELGKSILTAADPEIVGLLQAQGVDTSAADDQGELDQPYGDNVTPDGEVLDNGPTTEELAEDARRNGSS